ncbi:MAG TPA: hypothetical protein VKU93_05150 [Terracidiphilus sp.]|jgi:hypothetical protein|nr:hypothetical protein [Terracidiphilus sp.]
MLETSPPVRQRAHDLVERLTPVQLSALVDLLGIVAAGARNPNLIAAPFSDEPLGDLEQHDGGFRLLDSDFWPAAGRP